MEFAVQEVPDAEIVGDDGVPLARTVRGSPDTSDPGHPATGPRIVLFRRPLLARADDEDELSELVFDVVVEEFAEILGVEPEIVDPGYGEVLALLAGGTTPQDPPPATGGTHPPRPPLGPLRGPGPLRGRSRCRSRGRGAG